MHYFDAMSASKSCNKTMFQSIYTNITFDIVHVECVVCHFGTIK